MENQNFSPEVSMPESSANAFETKTPKRKFNKKIFIVLAVMVFLFWDAFFALAFRVYDPMWNPFRPNIQQEIGKALLTMQKIKTASQNVYFSFEGKNMGSENGSGKISATISGNYDNSDSQSIKSDSNLDLVFSVQRVDVKLNAELITIGNNEDYLKVGTIPAPLLAYTAMLGIDFNKISGKWIKLDNDFIQSIGFHAKATGDTQKTQKKTQEEVSQLLKDVVANSLIIELPDQEIGKIAVYHYVFKLDGSELNKIASSLGLPGSASQSLSTMTDELNKIGGLDLDIFIGKKDNLIYEIKIKKNIAYKTLVGKDEPGDFALSFDWSLSNFNQQFSILAPKDFIEMKDVINPLMLNLPTTVGK